MNNRSSFSGKLGFVLAAAGSAVGLGNIWRFPYLAAQYGGGTFLLVYLIMAVTFGFSLMIAEVAIGRKTGLSAIGAFKSLDSRFGFLGILAALVPIIIFPYYSVIGRMGHQILFRIPFRRSICRSRKRLFYRFRRRYLRTSGMVSDLPWRNCCHRPSWRGEGY